MVGKDGVVKIVNKDVLTWPKTPRLSTDQSLLAVNDPRTRWVWSFQVQPDGSLANGQPFYHLEALDESIDTDASGMTFDTDGYLYVATNSGIQICDQAGRVNAILTAPPSSQGTYDALFGGAGLQWLYTTDGEKMWRRKMKHRGAETWNPSKPPQPRL